MQEPIFTVQKFTPTDVSNVISEGIFPSIAFPNELSFIILQYLSFYDLINLLKVNKAWNLLILDKLLWQEATNKLCKGKLWHYLFRLEDIDGKRYFKEVLRENDVSLNELKIVTQLLSTDITNKNSLLIREYLKRIDFQKIETKLLQIPHHRQMVNELLRNISLEEADHVDSYARAKNYIKLCYCILQIQELEISLVELASIKKLLSSPLTSLLPLSYDWNILNPEFVIAVSVWKEGGELLNTIFADNIYSYLAGNFTEAMLIECCRLFPESTIEIFRNPLIATRLSNQTIVSIFQNCSSSFHSFSEEIFDCLIKSHPHFIDTMDAISFIQIVDDVDLAFKVLTHNKLFHKFEEKQIIILMGMFSTDFLNKLLNTEIFWSRKFDNISKFLLSYKYPECIISHATAAKLLSIEDVFPLALKDLSVGVALTKQKIFLEQLNNAQIVTLAKSHPIVAIGLIENIDVFGKLNYNDISEIKLNYELFDKYYPKIQKILDANYIKRYANKNIENIPIRNLLTPIHIHPLSYYPDFSHMDRPPSINHKNQTAKIILLSALALTGLCLCATGIGSLAGVSFMVGAFVAINVLNISLTTFGIISIFTGTLSTLASAVGLILTSIKDDIKPPIKQPQQSEPIYQRGYNTLGDEDKKGSEIVFSSPINHRKSKSFDIKKDDISIPRYFSRRNSV